MKRCCTETGAHVFEPRYTESTYPDIEGIRSLIDKIKESDFIRDQWQFQPDKFIITKKTYKCDICKLCGEIII